MTNKTLVKYFYTIFITIFKVKFYYELINLLAVRKTNQTLAHRILVSKEDHRTYFL